MGSRGAGSGRAGGSDRTPAADKTLKAIEKRTANLKNEQYRIVDDEGNILLEKRGDKHSVAATAGEKREYLKNATSIHNHPEGGTFSSSDFTDFGYGAKEIVAATPEGTYRLINMNMGKPNQKDGWVKLRDATRLIDDAESQKSILDNKKAARATVDRSKIGKELTATTQKWAKRRSEGASSAELQKLTDKTVKLQEQYSKAVQKEVRRLETQPYHDFYKKNASKYGFKYIFTPNKK